MICIESPCNLSHFTMWFESKCTVIYVILASKVIWRTSGWNKSLLRIVPSTCPKLRYAHYTWTHITPGVNIALNFSFVFIIFWLSAYYHLKVLLLYKLTTTLSSAICKKMFSLSQHAIIPTNNFVIVKQLNLTDIIHLIN